MQTKSDKKIIPLEGYCYVHSKISADIIKKAKKIHPDAKIVVHPECKLDVIRLADAVCSTSQMIKYVKESNAKEFILGTECGMVHRMKIEAPDKKCYAPSTVCLQMKKITLDKVYDCLKNEKNKIEIKKEIMEKARKALEAMLAVS